MKYRIRFTQCQTPLTQIYQIIYSRFLKSCIRVSRRQSPVADSSKIGQNDQKRVPIYADQKRHLFMHEFCKNGNLRKSERKCENTSTVLYAANCRY